MESQEEDVVGDGQHCEYYVQDVVHEVEVAEQREYYLTHFMHLCPRSLPESLIQVVYGVLRLLDSLFNLDLLQQLSLERDHHHSLQDHEHEYLGRECEHHPSQRLCSSHFVLHVRRVSELRQVPVRVKRPQNV